MKVTCDGTWSKRGFTALYGVVVVASWDTGKVLDVELKSKFCSVCSARHQMDETSQEFMDLWEVHQSECGCNYIDSSSGMECKGALSIWERSVKKLSCITPEGRPTGKKRRQALQDNRVELEEQSINEDGETYCAGRFD